MPVIAISEPTTRASAAQRHTTPSRSATDPNHASASQKDRASQNPTRPTSPANGRSCPVASRSHAM